MVGGGFGCLLSSLPRVELFNSNNTRRSSADGAFSRAAESSAEGRRRFRLFFPPRCLRFFAGMGVELSGCSREAAGAFEAAACACEGAALDAIVARWFDGVEMQLETMQALPRPFL